MSLSNQLTPNGIFVDEALTRKVAELARLELSEQEVTTFTAQLKEVLQYVDQLSKVDLDTEQGRIEPLTHPLSLVAPCREDGARLSPVDAEGKPKTLGPAPEVLNDGFKVPPIL